MFSLKNHKTWGIISLPILNKKGTQYLSINVCTFVLCDSNTLGCYIITKSRAIIILVRRIVNFTSACLPSTACWTAAVYAPFGAVSLERALVYFNALDSKSILIHYQSKSALREWNPKVHHQKKKALEKNTYSDTNIRWRTWGT